MFTVKQDNQGLRMIAGVRLNGRSYAQGDSCVYVPKVPCRGNAPGVGGQDGVSTSHLIGLINMFYTFSLPRGDITFVSLFTLPITHMWRDLFVTPTIFRHEKPGLNYDYITDHVIIHVDSIISKLFLVPHFNPDFRLDFMCGIPMWDAR